jgi:hypothetical protein
VRLPRSLDPAAVFEDILRRNGWTDSWRDGVYELPRFVTPESMGIAGRPEDHGQTTRVRRRQADTRRRRE